MNRPTAARRNPCVHTGLRPTVLAAALIVLAPWSSAQKLDGGLPPGLVSEDALKSAQRALADTQKKLEEANERGRRLEAQARSAANPPKPSPDPETTARLQKAETDLAQARQRIAQLEAQLKAMEIQRDEALADARAAAKKNNAADSKTEVALRRERDRLKSALGEEENNSAKLRAALERSQQEADRLQRIVNNRDTTNQSGVVSYLVTRALEAKRWEILGLSDGQELTVPGCNDKCPSFIVLPQAGRVTMGTGNEARVADFKHRLAMGKTEVTVAQWRHFMADSGYRQPLSPYTHCDWERNAVSDRHPVRCISAQDVDAYAAWFNRKYASQLGLPKLQVVLPDETEWEYAARAGRWTQERQWDSGIKDGKENCDYAGSDTCTGSIPDPVAKAGRKPNAWGLYDMIGNVWEWTGTPAGGSPRVLRGGAFNNGNSDDLRLSARYANLSVDRYDFIGVRLLARIDL